MIPRLARRIFEQWGYRIPVRVRGGVAAGLRWTIFPHTAYWRLGGAEPGIGDAISRHGFRPGGVCWDIGAHYGMYALAMARAVGPAGRVVAVEPDPESARRICRHRDLNNFASIVTVVQAGASDTTGELELHQSQGPGAKTSHFFYPDEPRVAGQEVLRVKTVALDDLVTSGAIRSPDFIKVDAEGHGGRALAGSRGTLAKRLPAIVMSFHGTDECADARRVLEPLNYRPNSLAGSPEPWPIGNFTGDLLFLSRASQSSTVAEA